MSIIAAANEYLARLRQFDSPPDPSKNGKPNFVLQLHDLLAESRLREYQSLSRTSEAEFFR
jgi:hypothetical protein